MGRLLRLTLSALNIQGIVCRLGVVEAKNTARKMKTHPHFAGLGDGSVIRIVDSQGLRGSKNKRKRKEFEHSPRQHFPSRLEDLDDTDIMDLLGKAHQGAITKGNQTLTQDSDGPWQLTILMLLGITCALLGLVIHASTDTSANLSSFRRRTKKKHSLSPPSFKKKTDEWSEDEADDTMGGTKRSTQLLQASHDPTASLYNQSSNLSGNYRKHDHRGRKLITPQTPGDSNVWEGSGKHSPHRLNKSIISGSSVRIGENARRSPLRTSPKEDAIDIGYGLEGFVRESSLPSSDVEMISSSIGNDDAVNVHPLVMPLGTFLLTESFQCLETAENASVPGGVDDSSSPKKRNDQSGHESQYFEDVSLLTTPRTHHTRWEIRDLSQVLMGVPAMPNLENVQNNLDAPQSVLLEELQLVRMESGVHSGPRWSTKEETEHDTLTREEKERQESKNLEKLKGAASTSIDHHDPRKNIHHTRTDLTICSDASSSLSSRISFSELKLGAVIGGGGFGQVWRAKWKGTPVAVKVLTGAAQAENVSTAVLEEFIAEINMVSGMRHPNICLFMGACLDPPNRAIVTELCENGSLWDALRSPLSIYQMADGMTRQAWPLDLYDERQVFDNIIPPLTPLGAWPWALVKRVAAGTARGMCYLHSGDPPVLHRDLKSANILLDESYTAKLADFGLSRLKAVRSGMTGNCGTVQWMAPEVLCSEHYAEPADVYSFGIILWEMLTQECPYEGLTPIQCALSVLNQNMRPVVPDWCPQPFSDLINGCVDRDPQSRPTFTAILAALDD